MDTFAIAARISRALPPFRGKGRMTLGLRSLLMGTNPIVHCQMAAGHRLRLDCRVQSHCWAYFSGQYDDAKISTLLSFLRPNGVALDVGANIGFYTVPMARVAKVLGARIVAVEPIASNCEWLEYNLPLNGCKEIVDVWPFALSDKEGEARMILSEGFLAGGTVGNAMIDSPHYGDDDFKRATSH